MNVAEKMREILPLLKQGFNDITTPDVRAECESEWNENYAIVQGLWYDPELDGWRTDKSDYLVFDHDRFRTDYELMVRSYFPGCTVRFYWNSQEIEVSQDDSDFRL